jgi:hypothetical protein
MDVDRGQFRMQMGVAVEPRAEAVEKGDGAEPWAVGRRRGLLRAEQRLDLSHKNPRHRRDGLGPVAEHSPQPRRHRHRYHGVFAPNHPLRPAFTALAVGNVGKRRDAAAPACGRGSDRAGNAASEATMRAPGAWQGT